MKFDLEVILPGRNNPVRVAGDDEGGSWVFTQPTDLSASEIVRLDQVFSRLRGRIETLGSSSDVLDKMGIANFTG